MKYLSEIRKELPVNCLFNKGKVGCGGTTIALKSEKDYVICVPFLSLIKNKIGQIDGLLGVYSETTDEEIINYLVGDYSKKILVTYDSLPRILNFINPADYSLLVDEYHILLTQYNFRDKAIKGVLNNFKKFKEYTFMTATPIEEEFILKELKDIPVVNQEWGEDEILTVKVNTVKTKNLKAAVLKLIEIFLNSDKQNAYFFVNSVEFIKEVLKYSVLKKNNTRVIYSKNNKLKLRIPNGETTDEPKRINFLTSTCFEGCDLYDENGVVFIVSDPNRKHSLIDISTSVHQIAGRIRNTKYASEIFHLYNNTRYADLSLEEFKKLQAEEERRTEKQSKFYNTGDDEIRERANADLAYINKDEENYFYCDANLILADTFNYRVLYNYSVNVNLNDVYRAEGMNPEAKQLIVDIKSLCLDKADTDYDFKQAVKECRAEAEAGNDWMEQNLIGLYSEKYEFLEDAIHKLGYKKIETLKYVQRDVKAALLKLEDKLIPAKIMSQLNYSTGEFIKLSDVKKKLQSIYNSLDLEKKAKAGDLKEFYDVKESQKRFDGKQIDGYIILRSKARIIKRF